MDLPRLYAIVDAGCFAGSEDPAKAIFEHARELVAGGVRLVQYRNKIGTPREMLSQARELRRILPEGVRLVMDDRADLCLAAEFDGVHVGQDDLPPEAVRAVIGKKRIVGFSTHNPHQVREADAMPVDYVAVGPVFSTRSKANPDPVIGLDGVRMARELTRKPLVAIGGITLENFRDVLTTGADSVAVIAELLTDPRGRAQEFLKELR